MRQYSEPFYNYIRTPIQNPVKFTKISKPFVTLEIQNLVILTILEYLKPDRYSESSQRFQMECFEKMFESYNYFSRALRLRSLAGFWIRISLNKDSLICRVTSCHVLYDACSAPCHIQNSFYYRKFRHIPIRHIEPCLGIFRTLCNSCISRIQPFSEYWHVENLRCIQNSLSRDILAYSERFVTLSCWEPCHIENFGIFPTRRIFRTLPIM